MRLDLYQAETAHIAMEQVAILNQVRALLAQERVLTGLEQNGALHALQILIENAIGKAKQILNAQKIAVPVSAYDAFAVLARHGEIPHTQLAAWNAIVGLRNRIVHDYMNIDMTKVLQFIQTEQDQFILDFLLKPITKQAD
ncbi:MAG: DUF86 domain-containing protein [Gallionella sp.]